MKHPRQPASRTATAEFAQWRAGGVTEELLRRNDGCIKVGRGCALVIAREKGAV
jgi:hypothetical protein